MTAECELLGTCGFFKNYGETKDLACKGFINPYCRGPKMNECKRKQYRKEHGAPPIADMMPNGMMIAALGCQATLGGAGDLSPAPPLTSPCR